MDIKHLHLNNTESTQKELKQIVEKELLTTKSSYLISTENQQKGVGRQGSKWIQVQDAIAFSFITRPSATLTLTPLEIGVHLAKYFSSSIKLKWPNDLLNNQNEKVGGIICQYYKGLIIAGVGLNLIYKDEYDFPYKVGGLYKNDHQLKNNFKKSMPLDIYSYILKNRMSDLKIKEEWNNYCAHQNEQVTITDNAHVVKGQFHSIGTNGEAVIKNKNGELVKILTGSLRFT